MSIQIKDVEPKIKAPILQSDLGELSKDYLGKLKMIFVVAKTYGVARIFVNGLNKAKFGGNEFMYLSQQKQLHKDFTRANTVVLLLSNALDIEDNIEIIKTCKKKKLIIIDCAISSLKQYAEVD